MQMYWISDIVRFPHFFHKFLEVKFHSFQTQVSSEKQIVFSGICFLLFQRDLEPNIFIFLKVR